MQPQLINEECSKIVHKQERKQKNNGPPLISLTALIATSIMVLSALIAIHKKGHFVKGRKEYSKQDTFQPTQITGGPQIVGFNGKASIRSSDEIASLVQRLKALYPVTYLTLISIIQSAALGYLALVVFSHYQIFGLSNWIEAFCSFLFIVSAWFEYMMGATGFVWIPAFTDSLIPFCLGAIELYEMNSIATSLQDWLLSISGLGFIAFWAFVNMFRQAKREFVENKFVLDSLGKFKIFSELFSFFGGVLFLILWLFAHKLGNSEQTYIIITIISTIIVIAFIIRSIFYWQAIIGKINRYQE